MIRADFFDPRSYNHALVYQLLIKSNIEIIIDLAVVNESQIVMVTHVARPYAVNCINWASLKLVEEAGDDFSAGLYIGDQDRDLVLIAELTKRLPGSMAHFKVPIRGILTTKLANNAIEVKYEQVLILQSLSSLEEDPLSDKCGLRRVRSHMLLSQALLIELYLAPRQFHLVILVELALACFFLYNTPLLG